MTFARTAITTSVSAPTHDEAWWAAEGYRAMTIRVSPGGCDTRNESLAISWRKALILNRAAILRAWNLAFPQHDFGTGRLKQYPLDSFERACDRAEELAGHKHESQEFLRTRRLLSDDISLERAWNVLNDRHSRPVPAVTVEAILHCVRERGVAALNEPMNIERLSHCDKAAMAQINQRIAKLSGIANHA